MHIGSLGLPEFLIISLLAIVPYFIPSIIAISRKHQGVAGIIVLNLLLGWTLIGWVGALIWSLSAPKPATHVHIHNPPSPSFPGRFCTKCGARMSATDSFCGKCGTRL